MSATVGSFDYTVCCDYRSVLYQRIPRMFGGFALALSYGRYRRLIRALGGGVRRLILDD